MMEADVTAACRPPPRSRRGVRSAAAERGTRCGLSRAEAAAARAQQSDDQALIAHLMLQIEKLSRDRYGPRSEGTAQLLDQLRLTLEELESAATEDELARRNRSDHHRGVAHAQARPMCSPT